MSHSTFIVRCLLVVAGVVSTSATARAEKTLRPDIVFIIVDDLNDWLGCLGGHPDAKSPNIDSLARYRFVDSRWRSNASRVQNHSSIACPSQGIIVSPGHCRFRIQFRIPFGYRSGAIQEESAATKFIA